MRRYIPMFDQFTNGLVSGYVECALDMETEVAKINEPRACYQHGFAALTATRLQERAMAELQPTQATTAKQPRQCENCGTEIMRRPTKTNRYYCNTACKAEWQRTQKPVGRDWLFQKYIVEGLGIYEIGAIVGRNPKQVWHWLRGYGIETRERGHTWSSHPEFSFWLHGLPSPFEGKRHTPENRRKASERCKAEGRVPYDPAIGSYMKGRRGADTTNWKGGITPERQAFYQTPEWKAVVPLVWQRDNASCQRCGKRNVGKVRYAFDIHHIVGFECCELRAELSNLVLLCEGCHYWVHSNDNTDRLFIKDLPSVFTS